MKVRPLQDRLLVKRVAEDERTKGGIIITDTAKEKPIWGEIHFENMGAQMIREVASKTADLAGARRPPSARVPPLIRIARPCDLRSHGGTDAEPRWILPRGIPRPGQRGAHSSGWLVA